MYSLLSRKCINSNPSPTDVDECQNSTHDCDQHCINTIGSYECSCDSGFLLGEDGQTCIGEYHVNRDHYYNILILEHTMTQVDGH